MKEKIVITLLMSLVSVGLADKQGEKIDEKELARKRQEAYKVYQENYGTLGNCTVTRSEARGQSIYFPENRSDIIVMYESGIYLAVQVRKKKAKLLWSLCDSRSGKEKPLKESQYKSHLWKVISRSYRAGVQSGKFPDLDGGYDKFYSDWDVGHAARISKKGDVVCSYRNELAEEGFEAEPKITKLCKP